MTVFGMDQQGITELVGRVRSMASIADDSGPAQQVAEVFARATWTGLAEPGDVVAGLVIDALGPVVALDGVVERWGTRRWLEQLADAGVDREAVLAAQLDEALRRWRPRVDSSLAVRALERAALVGAELLIPGDELWPSGVDDLGPHAPIALWWRGQTQGLQGLRRSIALVGARASTGYGEQVTIEAAAGLVDRGFTIVSGGAYGIDGAAHRSALASGGTTVAFLAGGVDRLYPAGHESLLGRVIATGGVAAELPCGAAPTRWRFLNRNRLIAAASEATVVVEAGWRSGAINTAGHAAAIGRPLGAVPGMVTSPTSAGCHRLMRDYDAICVTSPQQMADLVGMEETQNQPTLDFGAASDVSAGGAAAAGHSADPRDRTSNAVRILDALSTRSPRQIDDIARRSGMSIDQVRAELGVLDLDGEACWQGDGWVRSKLSQR